MKSRDNTVLRVLETCSDYCVLIAVSTVPHLLYVPSESKTVRSSPDQRPPLLETRSVAIRELIDPVKHTANILVRNVRHGIWSFITDTYENGDRVVIVMTRILQLLAVLTFVGRLESNSNSPIFRDSEWITHRRHEGAWRLIPRSRVCGAQNGHSGAHSPDQQ